MARLSLNVDSIAVQSFAVTPALPTAADPTKFPDCDTLSGGEVCCSDGCPDSDTCPDQPTCNRQCTWPECPQVL